MKRFIFIFSVISLMASCSKLPFVDRYYVIITKLLLHIQIRYGLAHNLIHCIGTIHHIYVTPSR